MRRYLPGLRSEFSVHTVPLEGIFLVRVDGAFYQYHPKKPFLTLRLIVLEPESSAGRSIVGRLYCSSKALWKVRWFLKDFGYDEELIGRDLVDGRALLGLRGVVQVSEVFLRGSRYPSLDGFAACFSPVYQGKTGSWSVEDRNALQPSLVLDCGRAGRPLCIWKLMRIKERLIARGGTRRRSSLGLSLAACFAHWASGPPPSSFGR